MKNLSDILLVFQITLFFSLAVLLFVLGYIVLRNQTVIGGIALWFFGLFVIVIGIFFLSYITSGK